VSISSRVSVGAAALAAAGSILGTVSPLRNFTPNNIATARVENPNRRSSYRAVARAKAKRRNIAKHGGGK